MSNESNEALSEDHALVIATVVEHHEDELALFALNHRDQLASIVRDLAAWGSLEGNESGFRATEKARLSA
jgi:myo-inositol catabolism protein IolC